MNKETKNQLLAVLSLIFVVCAYGLIIWLGGWKIVLALLCLLTSKHLLGYIKYE